MLKTSTTKTTRLVLEYLDAHKDLYTEREMDYIKRQLRMSSKSKRSTCTSSIIRQIFDELALIPEEENIYYGFTNLLEENFDIERNIVEAAGGLIPSLATKIALRQKTGTITVYDPRLITPKEMPPNLILKRQTFYKEMQIPTADMIIGLMPCEAAIPIIESAEKNEIDFMIGLCEGGARQGYEWLETDEEWIGYIKYIAKKATVNSNLGTLEEASLQKYNCDFPVIYNKRK